MSLRLSTAIVLALLVAACGTDTAAPPAAAGTSGAGGAAGSTGGTAGTGGAVQDASTEGSGGTAGAGGATGDASLDGGSTGGTGGATQDANGDDTSGGGGTNLDAAADAGGGGADLDAAADAGGGGANPDAAVDAGADAGGNDAGSDGTPDCNAPAAWVDRAICAANAFLDSLSQADRAKASLAFTDNVARTQWTNAPLASAGVQMRTLPVASQVAALAMMEVLLTDVGMTDLHGVRAADDYDDILLGGSGDGGATWSSGNYYAAVLGTPSTSGNWAVMFGGHHMGYNITFVGGVPYATPHFLGVEPKAPFTFNGVSYSPVVDESNALLAVFKSLSPADLAKAHLPDTYTDLLIGPVEYQTGSSATAKAKYPTGAARTTGILVSTMTVDQQALVTAAIRQWVDDYEPAIVNGLMATYIAGYGDTYVAWAGPSATEIDVSVTNTYMRIDGPRLWLEVSCTAGYAIMGTPHFHSVLRDKEYDYGATLP